MEPILDEATVRDSRWPRLLLPVRSEMSAEQAAVLDSSIARFNGPFGPRLPLILTPELHRAWALMSESLSACGLPERLRELAILVAARFWGAAFIWHAHANVAAAAGVLPQTLERIAVGSPFDGAFDSADEQAVAEAVTELLELHVLSDQKYTRAVEVLGPKGLVELVVLVGHYSSVALILNAHAAPLPDGADPWLSAPTNQE